MKIRCRREKFLPLFTLISSFTSTRDTRPSLQNVKMVADEKSVVLSATDSEIGAQGELSIEDGFVVESVGEVVLPAKRLRRILAETVDEEITLESNGAQLGVYGNNFRYQLSTWSAGDFPSIPLFDASAYHKIDTKLLAEMIRRTSFATDIENAHYALGGVLFNFGSDYITAVSTDGRRLAIQKRSAESVGGHASENKAIFPLRSLNLIERAVGEVDEALIAVSEGRAIIRLGNVVVSTILKEGRFPNWNAIVPDKSGKSRVDFLAGQLASAVRQAEIVVTEKKPGVWFHFGQGKANIAASGEEIGESNIELPIVYEGAKSSLRLDPRFLNEFLRSISPDETIAFYFQPDSPVLFETTDDYKYVVMPLT